MEKLLLLFACVFAAAYAQGPEPHRCVAPPYFQGDVMDFDHITGFFKSSYISYDAVEQRVRTLQRLAENATHFQVDELVLHKEKRRYRLDLETRKCNVTVEESGFRPIAVPDHSRHNGEFRIGVPEGELGEGMILDSWTHEIHDMETKIAGNFSYAFAQRDCVPVSELFIGESIDTQHRQIYHFHRNFYDVTLGLNDPNVFDVPTECRAEEKLHFKA